MNGQFQYDAFLSHNSADKLQVRRLAERLRAAGLRVWFDEWVIRPGDDIYLAIERGLEASRTLVLCLSPAALGSNWVGLERSTVLFRDPSNAARRFVPLLLADCELPDTLRRYKYLDFRREPDAAFDELIIACRGSDEPTPSRAGSTNAPEGLSPAPEPTRSPRDAIATKPPAFDLAGHWTATARQGDGEPYEVFLTFQTFGDVLAGSVSYPTGNCGILEGKFKGDTISFMTQHVPNFSSEKVTIQWHAKVVGQELHGITQSPDGQAEFTATRSATQRRYGWKSG